MNYRHGENFLLKVKSVKGKKETHKEYIVGHSESGHHHVLESTAPFDVHIDGAETFLVLTNKAKLVHQKTVNRHNDITVAPGKYKVIHKLEYNPFEKVMTRVFD